MSDADRKAEQEIYAAWLEYKRARVEAWDRYLARATAALAKAEAAKKTNRKKGAK